MPRIVIHRNGQRFEGEVKDNSNLVVRAGIKQFPFPNLSYGCGMAKCAKCVSRILSGVETLAQAMQGTLSARNAPAHGAEFRLALPLAKTNR